MSTQTSFPPWRPIKKGPAMQPPLAAQCAGPLRPKGVLNHSSIPSRGVGRSPKWPSPIAPTDRRVKSPRPKIVPKGVQSPPQVVPRRHLDAFLPSKSPKFVPSPPQDASKTPKYTLRLENPPQNAPKIVSQPPFFKMNSKKFCETANP